MHVTADRLLVPWLKNDLGERVNRGLGIGLASWIPAWLRERFVDAAATTDSASERLYISRSKRGTRGIVDEDELIEGTRCERVSGQFAWRITPSSSRPPFSTAPNVVVGAHGAGLTNIAFCRKGYARRRDLRRLRRSLLLVPGHARRSRLRTLSERGRRRSGQRLGTRSGGATIGQSSVSIRGASCPGSTRG